MRYHYSQQHFVGKATSTRFYRWKEACDDDADDDDDDDRIPKSNLESTVSMADDSYALISTTPAYNPLS